MNVVDEGVRGDSDTSGCSQSKFPISHFRANVKAIMALNQEFVNNLMYHPVQLFSLGCIAYIGTQRELKRIWDTVVVGYSESS